LATNWATPLSADYWKFMLEGRPEVYIQRLLDMSVPTRGYKYQDIMAGKYGEPGAALMLFRTYPRIPFWEQVHDSEPFHTDCGRLASYCDIPEAIDYGENMISHREGPEATPYLPNVIVSSSRFMTPRRLRHSRNEMGWDERTIRNIAKTWSQVKNTTNPLWEQGFHFYCLTPKTRHRVHSSWSTVDWTIILDSNFGDPYRADKRLPGVGDHQLHMHPQAAKDLGIEDGDYVYVDANPADRPYRGWNKDDFFYKVSRLMLRVKYNPAYPYNIIMLKHGPLPGHRKIGARPRKPARRPGQVGRDRLPGQPALRFAAVYYPRLVDAHAPDRYAVPQAKGKPGFHVRRRGR
jgi:nitrate reductase / nitrite oxidoreductase, alpha subunit